MNVWNNLYQPQAKDMVQNIKVALDIINKNRGLNIQLEDPYITLSSATPVGISKFEHIDDMMMFIKTQLYFTSPQTGRFTCSGFSHVDLLVNSGNQTALNNIQTEILNKYNSLAGIKGWINTKPQIFTVYAVNQALNILRDHKHLDSVVRSFELLRMNDVASLQEKVALRFKLSVKLDHHEELWLDYVIPNEDIVGLNSLVNKYVGNLDGLSEEVRNNLRLAWVIYNGYRYALARDIDPRVKDFLPRVTEYHKRVIL